jgi:hypothetical protein
VWALALALPLAVGCAGGGELDGGHDVSRVEVAQLDRPLLQDSPQDVAWAWDVAPTVDVTTFDAASGNDGASLHDASSSDGHAEDAAAIAACMALADEYASAVRGAQVCSSRGDCSALVCETLCCNCHVYVNPAASSAAMLDSLTSRWHTAGCDAELPCTPMTCDPPASAECSMAGRCTTLRSAPGSG